MGISGVGIAGSVSNLVVYLCLLKYTSIIPDIQEALSWPSSSSFTGLEDYLRIGIPSALMLCIEWWAFEVMTLVTGYISVDAQASQVVILNIIALMFMFSLGLQQAAASTIGQCIGSSDVK